MFSVLLSAILTGTSPQATNADEVRARALARAAQFQRERFVQAGFPPIAESEPEAFRRLALADPYMFLAVPGIELARAQDGETTLVVQFRGWRSAPTIVDADVWDDLVPDAEVFAPRPAASADRGPPPAACHAWSAAIQSNDGRIGTWHGCSGGDSPVSQAALQMVKLALSTRPDCEFDPASAFFAFQDCFRARPELDDPALEAVFGPLRSEYDAAPGSERLLEARQALQALGDTPEDAEWSRASAAVAGVRAVSDYRRDRLQRLVQLDFGATNASAADKAKMRQTIEGWSSFLASQDRNYIALLEDLVRKSGRPGV